MRRCYGREGGAPGHVKVVLDTNVFVSAVFFGGVPGRILSLWRDGQIDLLLAADILMEYEEILYRLHHRYPGVDPTPIIGLLVRRGVFVEPVAEGEPICADRDDDKFLLAAAAGACPIVISGDRHVLDANGWQGIEVLTPALFMRRCRSEQEHPRGRRTRRRR
jgi:uncharacterized protein